jgi:hypothetical protein
MNEMRKLMEAVQLNEYLLRDGESVKTLLQLNVFGDTGHREDGVAFSPDDISWEEGELDPQLQKEWLRKARPYIKQAGMLKREILKAAKAGKTLSHAEANYAENTWYDGSDLYGELEMAYDELPQVWDNQLEAVLGILSGEIEENEGDYAAFGEANQGGKTEHSGAKKGKGAYYGRKKEAKRDSNKNRRKADKFASKSVDEDRYTHFDDKGETYSLGTVEVTVWDDEISLKHGHGENINLSREEFSDFIRGIAHNRLNEEYGIDQDGESYNIRGPREATVALHELMDEGILDARTVADACLNYMPESEVEDMASDNSFFGDD